MSEPIKLQLGSVLIEIWNETRHVRTTFPDGQMLGASPEDTDEYRQKAKELGYRDTWSLCWQHEVTHCLYMQELGFPYSLALHTAAQDKPFEPHHYQEEETVLMLQKWINTGNEDDLNGYMSKLEYPIEFRAKVMRVFEQVQMTPEQEYNSHQF